MSDARKKSSVRRHRRLPQVDTYLSIDVGDVVNGFSSQSGAHGNAVVRAVDDETGDALLCMNLDGEEFWISRNGNFVDRSVHKRKRR